MESRCARGRAVGWRDGGTRRRGSASLGSCNQPQHHGNTHAELLEAGVQVSHAVVSYVSWSYNRDYTSIGGGRYTWTFTGSVYQNIIVNDKAASQFLGTVKHRCTS